jgi:DNA polymerase III subunit delta'
MRDLVGQPEATRLLDTASRSPTHAYLLHGPRGAGKDEGARAFIAEVLGSDRRRVDAEVHPDLYVVEPEGEAILIDQIRELRADLHLRPFEAQRRAYLIREAETMGRDAGNALLKSLEEPPDYAVFVLVCNDRARMLPTIASRCQPVRFRVPADADIAVALGGGEAAERTARLARGDLRLARRLHDDTGVRARFDAALDAARDAGLDDGFDVGAAVREAMAGTTAAGDAAEALEEAAQKARAEAGERLAPLKAKAAARRRRRRAETDEVRLVVDAAISLWRDVLCAAVGAREAVISSDRLDESAALAQRFGEEGAGVVLEHALAVRRSLELPVIPSLALQRLYHSIALGARGSFSL